MASLDLHEKLEPLLSELDGKDRTWLAKLFQHSATYDAYKAVENELFIRNTQQEKALLVASTLAGEGRTTLTFGIAVLSCLFNPGKRVLMVDADFEFGGVSQAFQGAQQRAGLHEFFIHAASAQEVIHETALPGLSLAPVAAQPGITCRLSVSAFDDFLRKARVDYDLIVVDSAAGSTNSDITVLADIIGQVVLVVRYQQTSKHQTREFLTDLSRTDAKVLGCILNQRKYSVPKLFYGAGR